MAFDIQKNKRLADDGIEEVDSNSNETTLNLVEEASKSNVLATQAWVSKMLRRFCFWTRLFHTDVLHATSEVVTTNVKAKEAHLDEIYANSIILTNSEGGLVKIKVGPDGRIDIEETLCDVFVYPGECLVRDYLYRYADVVKNFAGLTPYQTLLNFVPFVGWKSSEFNGQTCYILCTADGRDEFIGRTLLFNVPPDKVVKRVVVLDADGEELKFYSVPYEDNIRQLTINLPRFYDPETEEMRQVMLPEPSPIWTGTNGCATPSAPATGSSIGDDIYEDEVQTPTSNEIDPEGHYEVVQDEYSGNTYYNIAIKKDFFTNNSKAQYLMVELMNRTNNGESNVTWGDDTGSYAG